MTSNDGKWWQTLNLRETKQIIHHSKGIDKSYQKMYLLLNLCQCQKLWAFVSDFTMPTHQIKCNNSTFIIRKSHKISSRKALYFRS